MYTTYHLSSAQELSTDILDAIKATFKSKPITIIVEEENEDGGDFELTDEQKAILDECMKEDISDCIAADKALQWLKEKHGV